MSAVAPAAEPEIIDASVILADVKTAATRIPASLAPDLRAYLENDLLPSLVALAEKVAEHEDVIEEVAAEAEMVSVETAALLLGVVDLGALICKEFAPLASALKDKRRTRYLLDLVQQYNKLAEVARQQIAALSGGEDDGEDVSEDEAAPEETSDVEGTEDAQ